MTLAPLTVPVLVGAFIGFIAGPPPPPVSPLVDPLFVEMLRAEDTAPETGLFDVSAEANHMTTTTCDGTEATQDTALKHAGASSVHMDSTAGASCSFACTISGGCDVDDFRFTGTTDKFTTQRWLSAFEEIGFQYRLNGTKIADASPDGWRLYAGSDEKLCFETDDGTNPPTAICAATPFVVDQEFVVSADYDAATTTGHLWFNGELVASSTSMVNPASTGTTYYGVQRWQGNLDEAWTYREVVSPAWQRKLATCGLDLALCTCAKDAQGNDTAVYASTSGNHATEGEGGGFIKGTLPPCNETTIGVAGAPTTSTTSPSTTTTTSTSTSTSTTTTTSTSSTTSSTI